METAGTKKTTVQTELADTLATKSEGFFEAGLNEMKRTLFAGEAVVTKPDSPTGPANQISQELQKREEEYGQKRVHKSL